MVVAHRYPLAREGVRLYDVRSSLQIAPVDILHDVGTCQIQHIVVTLHQSRNIPEHIATEVLLRQAVALNHRSHCAVKQQYTLFYNLFYLFCLSHHFCFFNNSPSTLSAEKPPVRKKKSF